jgi:hypothetical protein
LWTKLLRGRTCRRCHTNRDLIGYQSWEERTGATSCLRTIKDGGRVLACHFCFDAQGAGRRPIEIYYKSVVTADVGADERATATHKRPEHEY